MSSRTCRVGLHGRNNVTFAEVDYQVINTAKIEAMKMIGQTSPAVFKRLKNDNPDIEIITRLYDDRFGTDTYPSPEQFTDRQIPIIKSLRTYASKFEIHNEPNHLHRYEGWGQEDHHAQEFNAWFLRVYQLIKNACPWALLGFPGLAIPHRDLEWIEICRPAVEQADWLGVHCYWQTPPGQEKNHLTDFWGLRFKYYHQKFPAKILEITECGNSNIQADPPIAISEEVLGRQYAEYYQELFKYPYINSAAFFILSSQDPNWDFFAWRSENGRIKPVGQMVGQMSRPPLTASTAGKITLPIDAGGTPTTIGGSQNIPPVQITNITDTLARSATAQYPTRSLSEVNRIIIHHTAVSEKVGPARIAKIQVERADKPGITYHYFIAENGDIYQTNNLTTVSDHTQGHNQNGLAICFAGNFTDLIPTQAQLKASGVLCASLMLQLNITPTNVTGATELVNTQSPGKQWLTDKQWKTLLTAEINQARGLIPASPIVTTPVTNYTETQIAELIAKLAQAQARITQLEAELARIKREESVTDDDGQLEALKERIAVLELQLSIAREAMANVPTTIGTPTGTGASISPPPIENITDTLPRHPTERYPTRSTGDIKTIVVHHTAVPATITPERLASFSVTKSGWPGIGFHFVIAEDGAIRQTNALETVSFHAGSQNATSVGVAFAGEFSNTAPADAQITRAAHLIAWLLNSLNLPSSAVRGHNELAETPCPGKQWDSGQTWRDTLREAIQAHLTTGGGSQPVIPPKKPYHVMLFSTQQDVGSAANYISKFQPMIGFTVEEAIGAKYVSVVGNNTRLSAGDETRLKAGGAKIERVAGNSPQAIKALLDNLVRINRRFLTIEGA